MFSFTWFIFGVIIGVLADDLIEVFDYIKKKFITKKAKFRNMNKL